MRRCNLDNDNSKEMLGSKIVLVPILLCFSSEGFPLPRLKNSSNTVKNQDSKHLHGEKFKRAQFAMREEHMLSKRKSGLIERISPVRISHQKASQLNSNKRRKDRKIQSRKENVTKGISGAIQNHTKLYSNVEYHSSIRNAILNRKRKKNKINYGKRSQIDDGNALVITGDDSENDLSSQDTEAKETNLLSESDGRYSILPYPGGFPPRAGPEHQTGGQIVVVQPEESHQPYNGLEIENVPTQNTMCNVKACSLVGQSNRCKCVPSGHSVAIEESHNVPNSDITIVLKGMNTNLMTKGFLPMLRYWYMLYLNALKGKIEDWSLKDLGLDLGRPGCSAGLLKIFKTGLAQNKDFAGIFKVHTAAGNTKTDLVARSRTGARNKATKTKSLVKEER